MCSALFRQFSVHRQSDVFLALGFFNGGVLSFADVLSSAGESAVVEIPVRSLPGTDIPVSIWSLLFLFSWPWTAEIFTCPDDSLAL